MAISLEFINNNKFFISEQTRKYNVDVYVDNEHYEVMSMSFPDIDMKRHYICLRGSDELSNFAELSVDDIQKRVLLCIIDILNAGEF